MKNVMLFGGAVILLCVASLVAFPRHSAPLRRLAESNLEDLSCSGEIVAEGLSYILYTDQMSEEVTFLSGREVQGYEGVSAVNSRSVSYLILENRAWRIFGAGFNGETLLSARILAREQLYDTITCSAYLPSDVQYGPTGERVAHIRRSDLSESSIEIIVARTHEEITDFLTNEQTPPEHDNLIDGDALLTPTFGD